MVNLVLAVVAILLPISISAQSDNFQNQFNGPNPGFNGNPSSGQPNQGSETRNFDNFNGPMNQQRNFENQQGYGPQQRDFQENFNGPMNQQQNFQNQQGYGAQQRDFNQASPQFSQPFNTFNPAQEGPLQGRLLLPNSNVRVETQQVVQNQPQRFNNAQQQIASNFNQFNQNQPLVNNLQQPHLQPNTQFTATVAQAPSNQVTTTSVQQNNGIFGRGLAVQPATLTTAYRNPLLAAVGPNVTPVGPVVGPYVGVLAASQQAINNAIAAGANPNDFPVQSNAQWKTSTTVVAQQPPWAQLEIIRPLDQILSLASNAVAGKDYPNLTVIPTTSFSCAKVQQPGFYADAEAQCQVYRRCDTNGIMWSFLCPAGTLFNQVTLGCDHWYNVQCNTAQSLYDYSNSRLYKPVALLD